MNIRKIFRLSNFKKAYDTAAYQIQFKHTCASKQELCTERKWASQNNGPFFSIVIPLYKTPEKFLKDLIQSILDQSYYHYEVCFVDASPNNYDLASTIYTLAGHDFRFRYQHLSENLGISENTNMALKMAAGDYIVFCDHDDLITPDALYRFAEVIVNDPLCDCLYSDEDKIDQTGHILFVPHFKPDFNKGLLLSNNYICHLFCARKTMIDEIGGLRKEYDGAQDYDFILRLSEKARHICHIPKILYHWRTSMNSTALNPASKTYAFENGRKAIEDHCKRMHLDIERVEDGPSLGIYHTVFKIHDNPLVSVITTDHKSLRSLYQSTYKNLEIIYVGSHCPKEKVIYIPCTKEMNFAEKMNLGADYAQGKYLFFMDNLEMMDMNSISDLLGYAELTGTAGSRLMYSKRKIAHAGISFQKGILYHNGDTENNYFNRALTTQDVDAVYGPGMMTEKNLFNELHGFDESLNTYETSISYCRQSKEKGRRIIYDSSSVFHIPSKIRQKN